MAMAIIHPEPEKGGRGKKSSVTEGFISSERLSLARTLIAHAADLADNVLAGTTSLDAAYEVARERKNAAASKQAQIDKLRESHPELADKVVEGELTLEGARAEATERDQNAKASRGNLFTHLGKIVYVAEVIGSERNVIDAANTLRAHSKDFEQQERYTVDDLISAIRLAQNVP